MELLDGFGVEGGFEGGLPVGETHYKVSQLLEIDLGRFWELESLLYFL